MILALAAALALGQAGPDLQAPPAPGGPAPSAPGAALQEYEEQHVWFEELALVSHGSLRRWSTPFQGLYRRPLEGAEFYRVVGRADLAERFEGARSARNGVLLGIGVAMVAVPVLAFATLRREDCGGRPLGDFIPCQSRNQDASTRAAGISVGALAVGSLALALTWSWDLHPVDAPEARRLADEHNRRLKAKLGLAAGPAPALGPRLSLQVAPWRGGGTVGLGLAL